MMKKIKMMNKLTNKLIKKIVMKTTPKRILTMKNNKMTVKMPMLMKMKKTVMLKKKLKVFIETSMATSRKLRHRRRLKRLRD